MLFRQTTKGYSGLFSNSLSDGWSSYNFTFVCCCLGKNLIYYLLVEKNNEKLVTLATAIDSQKDNNDQPDSSEIYAIK